MNQRRRLIKTLIVVAGLLALCGSGTGTCPALADGAPGLSDGWLLSPRETDQVLASRPDRWSEGPTDAASGRWGVWAAAGQGRLYGVAELPLMYLELGLRPGGSPLVPSCGLTLERLGGDFLRRDMRTLLLRWGDQVGIGVRGKSSVWALSGVDLQPNLACDLEVRARFGLGRSFTGVACFYLHPWQSVGWPQKVRRLKVAEFKVVRPGVGLACRLDRLVDGAPVLALEGMVRLAPGVGVGVRGDPATGGLGGNLVVRFGGMRLESSHLVHPVLGVTHRFMVGAGDSGASPR